MMLPVWCEPVASIQFHIRVLGSEKLTPLNQSGGSKIFESSSAFYVSLRIEVVVDGRVDRDEFLQSSHLPEPEHGAFSPSKR